MPFYKKYLLVIICIIGGYFSLMVMDSRPLPGGHTLCLFKTVTGIPCPGCGMGRATIALAKCDLPTSLYYNFLCIPFNLAILVILVWMIVDLIRGREIIYPYLTRPGGRIFHIAIAVLIASAWLMNILHGI